MADESLFVSCDRCGRPIREHRIFRDEPPPGHGLTEATFGDLGTFGSFGFYCPPEEPRADVWPRLVALIDDLRAIPGVRARIDVNVTVTMEPTDG